MMRPPRNLTVLFAKATEEARQRLDETLGEAAARLEWWQRGAPGAKGCTVCDLQVETEDHHIAGRRHGSVVVPLCVNCHGFVSRLHNRTDPRWHSDVRSPTIDETLFILGLADLCEAAARYHGVAYVELADRLRAVYAVRARETVP